MESQWETTIVWSFSIGMTLPVKFDKSQVILQQYIQQKSCSVHGERSDKQSSIHLMLLLFAHTPEHNRDIELKFTAKQAHWVWNFYLLSCLVHSCNIRKATSHFYGIRSFLSNYSSYLHLKRNFHRVKKMYTDFETETTNLMGVARRKVEEIL